MRITAVILLVAFLAACTQATISSFEDCVAAGNPVMESFPRQCAAGGQTFVEEIPEDIETPEAPPVTGQAIDDLNEFAIVGHNWGWEPSEIAVQKGDRVRLVVTSREGGHGLAISEFGVKTGEFGAGETKTVEFVADKIGSFRYYCNVFCGEGHRGMAGTLTVTE